jgi:hypothetical protein
MTATPRLSLPLLAAGQAQKHVTHNDALTRLDGLIHLAVASRSETTPPGSPTEPPPISSRPAAAACLQAAPTSSHCSRMAAGVFWRRA